MDIQRLRYILGRYGKVERCAENDGFFEIKITDGFSNNAVSLGLLREIDPGRRLLPATG